jgi:hypothetical protein
MDFLGLAAAALQATHNEKGATDVQPVAPEL